MRLFFSILVLFGHSFFLSELGSDPIQMGGIAVGAFFIISGFLISNSWMQRRSLWDYLRKRIARIYPGFAGVWILMSLLVAGYFVTRPLQLLKVPVHILMLEQFGYPGLFSENPYHDVNGSLWTIGYEFRCYLLLPLLAIIGLDRKRWTAVCLLVVALLLTMVEPAHLHIGNFVMNLIFRDPAAWPRLIACYAGGMVFYFYRAEIPRSPWLALLAAAVLALTARSPFAMNLAMPIAGTYLLMWIAYQPLGLSRFSRYGDFSYGVYLYAFLMQQIVVALYHGHITPTLLSVASLPLTLLAGVGSWYGIERHFLRAAHSRRPSIVAN